MPRKKTKSLIRDIQPDRVYQNVQVQRLINRVMLNGKKQLAERLVYGGMQKAAQRLKVDNPLVWHKEP
jgi:small subunit ribosomal protein S7